MFSCQTESARLRKIKVDVQVQRFEQDLFLLNKENFAEQLLLLENKYGAFFTLFCSQIIDIGTPDSADFEAQLLAFLQDTVVQQGYAAAQRIFADTKSLNRTFTNAFKRYKLHFATDSIPQVYTFVAGFNHSVVLADGVVAIGLDKYLGTDFAPYSQMGFYRYLLRNMYPAKMPGDAIHYIAEQTFASPTNSLLQRMIWEGKLLYFTQQLLPDAPDTCLFGFSAQQIKSCLDNEAFMWNVLVRDKLLFSQNRRLIREMTEDAPFTSRFSQQAPGKAANWIGYRIVAQYMRRHRDLTLPQLMTHHNAQEILDGSGYNPR
ncbi:hypothetical protein AGMMS4956_01580 [Bacteroidia bacterium]|nr:hypothetical protein AGMMS4956_01580 [Bacteroidia bacterium]